jgi:hypothetical protein
VRNRPDVQLFNNNCNLAAPSEVGGGWKELVIDRIWMFLNVILIGDGSEENRTDKDYRLAVDG